MTGGGPVDATNVIVLYLYQQAFQFFRMGYASAVAYVLFALIFLATLSSSACSVGGRRCTDGRRRCHRCRRATGRRPGVAA